MGHDTTLTDFLHARITEDEEVASAASHGGQSWFTPDPYGYGSGAVESSDGPDDEVGIVVYDEGLPSEAQAAHIARHDPARVLAECDAKRRIIEWATEWEQTRNATPTGWSDEGVTAYRMASGYALHFLALPYATHPDYRQEWAL